MRNDLQKLNGLVFLVLFISLFLLKAPILRLPHHWDATTNVVQTGFIYYRSLNEFVQKAYHGHPPLFHLIIAGAWKLFGCHPLVNHTLGLMFASLALWYTFLLGQRIAGFLTGAVSAALLLFSPMFFAQSGILNYAMPLTAFLVMTVYYAYTGNIPMYAVFGSCLVMTKEPGVLVVLGVLIYRVIVWAKDRSKDDLNRAVIASLPLIVYGCWLVYHKLATGWFLFPEGMGWGAASSYSWGARSFQEILRHFLFDDYRLILFICMAASCCRVRSIRKGGPWFLLFFLIVVPQVLFFTFFHDFMLIRYLLPVYPLYYLTAAYCLVSLLGEKPLAVSGVVCLLIACSVMNWDLNRDIKGEGSGARLESNMEYADVVRSHQAACRYIERHYPQAVVLTGWPQNMELTYPVLGYVTQKIKTVRFRMDRPPTPETDFDLVYCADQSHEFQNVLAAARDNLTLLREFDAGGKKTRVYQRGP